MEIWRILAVLSLTIGAASELNQDNPNWLTGKALEKAARSNAVSGNWTQAPLGQQLKNFSQAQKISIVLDRRVDSGQLIELQASDQTVEQFLWRVARACDLGVCQVGDSFYLGPLETAAALPVMLEQLENQDLKSAKGWKQVVNLRSDQPFEPASLLKSTCSNVGIEVENFEQMPMDLWAPVAWPKAPTYQHIAMMLVGFGLWPEPRGSALRLVEFQIPIKLKRHFRLPERLGLGKQLEELRPMFPQAEIKAADSGLTITADPATISKFAETVAFLYQAASGDDSTKRFSLKTNAMRGSILATIAQQAGLKLQYPPEAKPQLSERIQISLEQVPLNEMIETTLNGSGLEFEVKDGILDLKFASDQDKN